MYKVYRLSTHCGKIFAISKTNQQLFVENARDFCNPISIKYYFPLELYGQIYTKF